MRGIIHYLDGAASDPDNIAAISSYQWEEYGNGAPTLVDFARPGGRERIPLDAEILSICCSGSASFALLGKRGQVFYAGPDGVQRTVVAETYPLSLTRIRQIGGNEYVCGLDNSVFVRERDAWRRLGPLPEAPWDPLRHLRDIRGQSADSLFAVGLSGAVFAYDGARWRWEDAGTNVNLEALALDGEGDMWACGAEGTVIQRQRGLWRHVDCETEDNLWSVERLGGTMVFCSLGGIYSYDADKDAVVASQFDFEPDATFYRFHALPRGLLSVGLSDLLILDETSWRRVEAFEAEQDVGHFSP